MTPWRSHGRAEGRPLYTSHRRRGGRYLRPGAINVSRSFSPANVWPRRAASNPVRVDEKHLYSATDTQTGEFWASALECIPSLLTELALPSFFNSSAERPVGGRHVGGSGFRPGRVTPRDQVGAAICAPHPATPGVLGGDGEDPCRCGAHCRRGHHGSPGSVYALTNPRSRKVTPGRALPPDMGWSWKATGRRAEALK